MLRSRYVCLRLGHCVSPVLFRRDPNPRAGDDPLGRGLAVRDEPRFVNLRQLAPADEHVPADDDRVHVVAVGIVLDFGINITLGSGSYAL